MTRYLFLMFMLSDVALSQSSAIKPKKAKASSSSPSTKVQRLSGYMREASLLYIQTLEKAVDHDIVDSGLSDAQLETGKSLADHIELHLNTAADKDFFQFGLSALADRATLRAHLDEYVLTLAKSASPDASSKMADAQQRFAAADKLYIHCDSALREIVKEGQYAGYESIVKACNPDLLKPTN